MENTSAWLNCLPSNGPARMRLFCLPHAGSGALPFRTWSSNLPSFVQLCPILLPGRETRSIEPPIYDFFELVDSFSDELTTLLGSPYVVFGHSMGALLAFEWVRNIRRSGFPLPMQLFVSGRCAPDIAQTGPILQDLPDIEFLFELRSRYEGIPEEFLKDSELLEYYLPILRADISIVESYRYDPELPLECPITAFAGVDDPSLTWDELVGWKRQTGKQFTAQLFPGGHFYPQQQLLDSLFATLTELDVASTEAAES